MLVSICCMSVTVKTLQGCIDVFVSVVLFYTLCDGCTIINGICLTVYFISVLCRLCGNHYRRRQKGWSAAVMRLAGSQDDLSAVVVSPTSERCPRLQRPAACVTASIRLKSPLVFTDRAIYTG